MAKGLSHWRMSRRDFLGCAAGVGLGAATWRDRASFMSVGICDAAGHTDDYAAYGYAFVEPAVQRFLTPKSSEDTFKDNLEAIRARGLPVPVANQFLPSSLKVVGPRADHDAALRYAAVAFKRAAAVGIEHIVFGSGGARSVPEGFAKEAATEQFARVLARMAPMAHAHGITLCVEPLRSQETNLINTVPEAMAILKAVSHPAAQLTFDIYHITQEGRGADDVLLAGDAIKHCHIAENRDRRAPGVHGDDFTPFFAALKAIGYRGRISVECRWREREAELPVAAKVLMEQMAKV